MNDENFNFMLFNTNDFDSEEEIDNRHLGIWQWLYENPEIQALFFNFGKGDNGDVILTTGAADELDRSYIDGSMMKHYDFSIIQFMPLNQDVANDIENVAVMFDTEKLIAWVKKQNRDRNFPKFPKDCYVQRVEVLQNVPTAQQTNDTEAKYIFSCRVYYVQKSEVRL